MQINVFMYVCMYVENGYETFPKEKKFQNEHCGDKHTCETNLSIVFSYLLDFTHKKLEF